MPDEFKYDAFLSYSSKDREVVRAVAVRLREDGLRVWFDEWKINPGDSIPAKIEDGLEHSRVLVLCMSANAFGSDWAQLEGGTFRFRDPLNKERRFIPLRLDDAPIKGSLAQFLYINWLSIDREQEYTKLLEACRPTENRDGSVQTEVAISDANLGIAVSQTVDIRPGERPTVWVLGSYRGLDEQELAITRKLIITLGSSLAARRVRLVSGRSDMLQDLSAYCRNVAMSLNPRSTLPVMIEGKLRQTDLRELFRDAIGRIPNLAIVIGGSVGHRVAEECDYAEKARIPVLPVPATGGSAAKAKLTADRANDLYDALTRSDGMVDTNDLVAALLQAVERYTPNAGRAR